MPSTVIRKHHYDEVSRELTVEYISGAVYKYLQVPPDAYAAFCEAYSKGSFLNRKIKPVYEYVQVFPFRDAAGH